ncbi:MAG: AI-2E family transporter [Actinobacteria bacterium]|nr:AI-2E family transporter [Actinomycetota bacterium]
MAGIKRVFKKSSDKSPENLPKKEDFGAKGQPLNLQHPFYFGFLATTGALVAFALLQALQSASQVFILLIISLFLAMGLNPAVSALERRPMKRGIAVSLVVILVLASVVLAALVVIPPVFSQVNDFVDGAPQLIDSLRNNRTFLKLDQEYGLISTLESKFQTWFADGRILTGAFGGVLGVGRTVLSGAFSALTVLILTLYFLYSLPSVTKVFYRLAPSSRRERVSKIGDAIISRVGSFVGSQIVIAFFAAVFVFLLGLALDLPYPTKGLLAVILYALYVQIENYLITPRIMKRNLSIPGLVTIVAALLGTSLLGLVGGLLAVPIAAAVLLIMDEVVFPKTDNS